MKSRILWIAALIVTCAFAAAAVGAAAEFRTTMKITSTQGLDHPYMAGAKLFADAVKEKTKGRIVIELYPGIPDKTGERELIEAMKKGAFDLVVSSTGPLGAFSPSMNIVDIPYLFRDNAHADAVLDGRIGKALLADMDAQGIKGLAFWENGFRHLTNSRVSGRTCIEAKGLKIRVMENKVHVSAWKAAGLKPVAMAWGDLHQALVKGEVDGQENPVAVFYSNKFWEVQKFFTLTHHVYSPAPVLMNKERFYSMPLTDRVLFIETAVEVAKLQRKGNRDAEEQKLKEIEAKGVTVVRDVDRASYERAMAPAMARWYKAFGKDRIDAIKTQQLSGLASPPPRAKPVEPPPQQKDDP